MMMTCLILWMSPLDDDGAVEAALFEGFEPLLHEAEIRTIAVTMPALVSLCLLECRGIPFLVRSVNPTVVAGQPGDAFEPV